MVVILCISETTEVLLLEVEGEGIFVERKVLLEILLDHFKRIKEQTCHYLNIAL